MNEILPDDQINVLIDNEHAFIATNLANPRPWVEIEDGTFVAAETLSRRERRIYERKRAKRDRIRQKKETNR